jgi:hypothetical protein
MMKDAISWPRTVVEEALLDALTQLFPEKE